MDPLSQAALGAVVGQVAGYRRVGPRAAAIGAAAGMLPDIDVLFSINGSYFDQLLLHRGITHSLLFAPVVGPPLGWAVWRWEQLKAKGRPDTRPVFWMLVVSLALLSHPLLDYLTPYGTQLLLPFSDQRFAVAAMPIIDPVYTALLLVGLLCSRLVRSRALLTAVLTLLLSSAYLGYGWHLNNAAVTEARRQLVQAGITNADIAAFPTVLQLHYRRVVARTPDVDRVGFISMWEPCAIDWGIAPRAAPAHISQFLESADGRTFAWFTMGWVHYQGENSDGVHTVRASDLRYGATNDPTESIFAATMTRRGDAAPLVAGGQTIPDARTLSVAKLLQDAYAPYCRIMGQNLP